MPRHHCIYALTLIGLMLTACGGGGGGGSSAPAPTPPVNQPPTAVDDAFTGTTGNAITGNVLSNDTDPEGAALAVSGNTAPSSGSLDISSDGSFAYTSAQGFTGTDSFTYTATDGAGGSATATVTLTITTAKSFSMAGRVGVLAEAVLDVDTNNPDNTLGDNGAITTAQIAPNPASIGGYLASAGDGAPGVVNTRGDIEDYYRVDAFAGQRVSLVVANSDAADIDLYLYNEEGFIEAFSAGIGDLEEVAVPRDGIWYVNPSLYVDPAGTGGASNYTVSIGAGSVSAQQVVPQQLIVAMSAEQVLRPAAAEQRAAAVLQAVSGDWTGGERGRARRLSRQSSAAPLDLAPALWEKAQSMAHNPALQAQWQTWQLAKQVARLPGVASAEPNAVRRPALETNDQFAPLQWDHPVINLPAAWDFTVGSPEVIVAVVDSGIVGDHPDLSGQLTPGYDFVADPAVAGDGDGLDPDPTDDGAATSDDIGAYSYHGTHVTGIVAAAGNNQIGVAGVAYGARVMPLRALGGDTGSSFDVLQAIRFAAGLPNDSGTLPDRPANIINLSLGGDGASTAEEEVLRSIVANGTVVVAAAGNEGASSLNYPARYDSVIAVGATDIETALTTYSNTGEGLDVVAPGGESGSDRNGDGYPDAILSTGVADDTPAYTFLSGTSMATPVVAGVFALMQSVNPDLTADGITALLEQGALTEDLGISGYDETFGWGQIDAQRAVFAALDSIGQTPERPALLTASTRFVNLGVALGSFELTLDNRGTSTLRVTDARSDTDWLSIAPEATDANGLGRWRISADRQGLAEGQYRGRLTFVSTVNTITVDVSLRVSADGSGDVGVLYVLFYDPVADDVVFQAVASAAGNYDFSGVVPEGEYEIWAGTDNDNDQFICDAGEACGAYQTLDSPITLRFNQDRTGIDFPSGYRIELQSVSAQHHTLTMAQRPGLKRMAP